MSLPALATTRLGLRPWCADDVDTLHALWTRPEVRRHLWDDVIIARARADETVRRGLAAAEEQALGGWLAFDRVTDALAGFVALFPGEQGDPELLYGFAPEWWGRGFATEGSREALVYAFGPRGCSRVTAATDVSNLRSVRVLERLGMRFVRRGPLNGLDTVFYEIGREAFLAQPPARY